jgi:hypothetical protein
VGRESKLAEDLKDHEKVNPDQLEPDVVLEELTKPGTRLILPDKESELRREKPEVPEPMEGFRNFPVDKPPVNPHKKGFSSYTRIYANPLARLMLPSQKPVFPPGSIIVREKLLKETDTEPELVTVMIKREKGFSPTTRDWEFYTIEGTLSRIQKRETTGKCADCHAQAAGTDLVFKNYLQLEEITTNTELKPAVSFPRQR